MLISIRIIIKIKGIKWNLKVSIDISKRKGNTLKSILINIIEIGFIFNVNNIVNVNAIGYFKFIKKKVKLSNKIILKIILK